MAHCRLSICCVLGLLTAIGTKLPAQDLELSGPDQPPAPQPAVFEDEPPPEQLPDGAEVLVTGPLHEAYAEQFTGEPTAGLIVNKEPPEAIDEVPPEYRPDGYDIVWIPGYWGWDPDRDDFIWVTGIWRQAPPDRSWIPGYWATVPEGFQWISGFWALNTSEEIAYLPVPPEPLNAQPSTPAPSDDYFWIPGQWSYTNNDYQWRAGYWAQSYPDWVWVPDRYIWTPSGCIYRAGYWDYQLNERGTVFCPVYWSRPVASYRFRPWYVVSTGPSLLASLFVYPRYNHYYFGNYYSSRYLGQSMYPWVSFTQQSRMYDPLYGYYRTLHRDADYLTRISRLHNYYASNPAFQPARTLTMQQQLWRQQPRDHRNQVAVQALSLASLVNNTTNITNNNVNNINNIGNDFSNNWHNAFRMVRLQDSERERLQQGLDPARQLRRTRAEMELVQRPNGRPDRLNDGQQPEVPRAGGDRDNDNNSRNGNSPRGHAWKLPQADNQRLGSVGIEVKGRDANKKSTDNVINNGTAGNDANTRDRARDGNRINVNGNQTSNQNQASRESDSARDGDGFKRDSRLPDNNPGNNPGNQNREQRPRRVEDMIRGGDDPANRDTIKPRTNPGTNGDAATPNRSQPRIGNPLDDNNPRADKPRDNQPRDNKPPRNTPPENNGSAKGNPLNLDPPSGTSGDVQTDRERTQPRRDNRPGPQTGPLQPGSDPAGKAQRPENNGSSKGNPLNLNPPGGTSGDARTDRERTQPRRDSRPGPQTGPLQPGNNSAGNAQRPNIPGNILNGDRGNKNGDTGPTRRPNTIAPGEPNPSAPRPSDRTPRNLPTPGAGAPKASPANPIQDDLKQLRELGQRQSQRRMESAAPRPVPQAPTQQKQPIIGGGNRSPAGNPPPGANAGGNSRGKENGRGREGKGKDK